MAEEEKDVKLDGEEGGSKSIYAGLSKGQIKKLKEKMKAEREAAAKAGVETAKPESKPADAEEGKDAAPQKQDDKKAPAKKPAAKGKKAGPGAAIAEKIKAQQEAKAREQAEFERLQKEEEEREAAKEAARLAEIKRIKDEKEAKKKAKKDKIEELKKQGKYLTKKQQEQKAAAEARRRMFDQGKDEDQEDEGEEGEVAQTEDSKKNTAVRNRKKKTKTATQPEEGQAVKQAEATAHDSESEEEDKPVVMSAATQAAKKEQAKVEEEEPEFDDWEEAIDEVAEKIVKTTKLAADSKQPEEGDDSDEETKEVKQETLTQAAAKGGKKKPAKGKEEEKDTGASAFDNINSSSKDEATKRKEAQLKRLEEARKRRDKAKQKKLRCPIICVMGHVDTGKTLILDKLRRTNVQAGEAGGITQQIGATWFPEANLIEFLKRMNGREKIDLELPGFLVIDTPGHESFTNLRTRGSSLCDMAVLVVDIMHGLEQQTLESIQLLKQRNTPFCIALNKIDRLNLWKPQINMNSRDTLDSQAYGAKSHFDDQVKKTILAFNEQGFNVALYWENQSPEDTLSFVPTSAITGEGLSDLMFQLCQMGQTQETIRKKLEEKDEFECTVIEVKVIEGLGTTVDVVLVNGIIKVGDTIVLSGMNGPIVTKIRALLTPHPMKEMRVKGDYMHHKQIKGAMGIKISAPDMEHAMAGTQVFKCDTPEEIEEAKQNISDDLIDILDKYVDKTAEGVSVQASTIGSLEALLEYLYQMKIPVCSVNIGPVHKKDILKCMKSTAAGGERQHKEYATLLAFDVKVTPEAREFAEEEGIKVFTAEIIYHLFDSFTEYVKKCEDERKGDQGSKAVFPCILEMVKDACFNAKAPIIIGVNVTEGVLKIGTPLCIPMRDSLKIGHVQSIEVNKKPVKEARAKDGSVAVKIHSNDSIAYGRHFNDTDQIASLITRDTIDTLKEHFRDEMTKEDWQTVLKLKKIYGIA